MSAARDVISLLGLRARGRHGVFEFERTQGQDFVVDVVLELDLAPAAASDDVVDTVHYGELADRLVAIVEGEPVNLIETLADRLAASCLRDPRVMAATVTVHKPQAPIPHEFTDVGVTLCRTAAEAVEEPPPRAAVRAAGPPPETAVRPAGPPPETAVRPAGPGGTAAR